MLSSTPLPRPSKCYLVSRILLFCNGISGHVSSCLVYILTASLPHSLLSCGWKPYASPKFGIYQKSSTPSDTTYVYFIIIRLLATSFGLKIHHQASIKKKLQMLVRILPKHNFFGKYWPDDGLLRPKLVASNSFKLWHPRCVLITVYKERYHVVKTQLFKIISYMMEVASNYMFRPFVF